MLNNYSYMAHGSLLFQLQHPAFSAFDGSGCNCIEPFELKLNDLLDNFIVFQ